MAMGDSGRFLLASSGSSISSRAGRLCLMTLLMLRSTRPVKRPIPTYLRVQSVTGSLQPGLENLSGNKSPHKPAVSLNTFELNILLLNPLIEFSLYMRIPAPTLGSLLPTPGRSSTTTTSNWVRRLCTLPRLFFILDSALRGWSIAGIHQPSCPDYGMQKRVCGGIGSTGTET
jgi:hypothetical protein